MAIGDLATASSDTTASSLTYAHSVAGSSALCLWVCVDSFRAAGSSDPTGVTYAAAALTKLSNYLGGGGNDNAVSLWRKIAPATGSNNVVVTHSASHDITAMSISYSGVDQTTPNDAVSQNDVATDNPSQSVSSATGDQVVSFVCGWDAVPASATATGGLTSRLQNFNGSGVNSMAVGDAPGAASVTCSWTVNWNDGHGEMNFNVNADAGGGATLTGTASPSITLSLAPSARVTLFTAQATPSITLSLAPVALKIAPTTATPSITLSLATVGLTIGLAQATPSITLSLTASSGGATATATPSITLALAPSALKIAPATASPSVTLSLAPVALKIAPATATPSITLALAPSGLNVGLAAATPIITLSLGPTAAAVLAATASPSITLVLSASVPGVVPIDAAAAPAILLVLSVTAQRISTGTIYTVRGTTNRQGLREAAIAYRGSR